MENNDENQMKALGKSTSKWRNSIGNRKKGGSKRNQRIGEMYQSKKKIEEIWSVVSMQEEMKSSKRKSDEKRKNSNIWSQLNLMKCIIMKCEKSEINEEAKPIWKQWREKHGYRKTIMKLKENDRKK